MRPQVLALLCIHLIAATIGAEALAQPSRSPRPAGTARMTCAEAMALVKSEGDVVIAGGTAPERFVSGPGQCSGAEIAELRFVPTRDNPQCPIGYRCREPGFEEWNW
ncbi:MULTISPECIES: hypothetical protein [Methylobacterium]|jgi:hypothetical protein|uniref:Uncharacterized protein n=1 Tax=Methylobacterium brachiatum TaxID=269660 RepID=A0AAJ1TKI3_9HYPH|nr:MULTISPECIES: hypothetical protein [Methylobacterium]AYO85582.1 hypothetical protein EBB05_27375 [Methylobacterium brachiatum]EIZ85348.1 hypothetical protein WYO_1713 [Methylobacterium sp. GXF4]MCB4802031.1 hypothetical protein [Methylobacterium brachiatum]MDF2599726.1 hypothetical protein [Methylobacterium brachiatum]MDQ0542371.1 hypothetical protein [Methylobacterium brachiatum]